MVQLKERMAEDQLEGLHPDGDTDPLSGNHKEHPLPEELEGLISQIKKPSVSYLDSTHQDGTPFTPDEKLDATKEGYRNHYWEQILDTGMSQEEATQEIKETLVAKLEREAKPFKGKMIIVVDDEEQLRTFGLSMFGHYGADVTAVKSFEEVERHIAELGKPDLIFTDLDLKQDKNGFDIAKFAKDNGIPAILASGRMTELKETPEEFAQMGVSATLAKPYRAQRARETAERVLGL